MHSFHHQVAINIHLTMYKNKQASDIHVGRADKQKNNADDWILIRVLSQFLEWIFSLLCLFYALHGYALASHPSIICFCFTFNHLHHHLVELFVQIELQQSCSGHKMEVGRIDVDQRNCFQQLWSGLTGMEANKLTRRWKILFVLSFKLL